MFARNMTNILRFCMKRSCKGPLSRSRTTYRNADERGVNIYDKAHSEKLKYKQKDQFFDQQLQNPATKADKDILHEYLKDEKKVRKPSDLSDPDRIVK